MDFLSESLFFFLKKSASQYEGERVLFDGKQEHTFITLVSLSSCHCSSPLCLFTLCLTRSPLSSPWRKRQLQFLLEGRGRRAGLSPEELRDNGKLLGEGLSRALFNYPSRDFSAESPEVSSVFCFFFTHGQMVWETAATLESDWKVSKSPTLTQLSTNSQQGLVEL